MLRRVDPHLPVEKTMMSLLSSNSSGDAPHEDRFVFGEVEAIEAHVSVHQQIQRIDAFDGVFHFEVSDGRRGQWVHTFLPPHDTVGKRTPNNSFLRIVLYRYQWFLEWKTKKWFDVLQQRTK